MCSPMCTSHWRVRRLALTFAQRTQTSLARNSAVTTQLRPFAYSASPLPALYDDGAGNDAARVGGHSVLLKAPAISLMTLNVARVGARLALATRLTQPVRPAQGRQSRGDGRRRQLQRERHARLLQPPAIVFK